MKLSFIKNTNLFSLLMFSLTSLPISSASCSVNNKLNNEVSNSFINLSELSPNRSSITSKLYSTNNGYLFLQGGHNFSMFSVLDSYFSKPIYCDVGGSIHIDVAYRYLFNRSLYINGGLGFKVGKLSTEPYKGLKESLNYGLVLFGGLKHNSGIELSFQGDAQTMKNNNNEGLILNIKYGLFSVELGLSNLYKKIGASYLEANFIVARFNIIELISKLGVMSRKLSRFIDIQILIGLVEERGKIFFPELSFGLFKKYNGVLEEFNNIGKILKNNTMEYGWQKLSKKEFEDFENNELFLKKPKKFIGIEDFNEYYRLVILKDKLHKSVQEKLEKDYKEIEEYIELFSLNNPIPIDIIENMQGNRQEFKEELQEVMAQMLEEEREIKASLSGELIEIYDEFMKQNFQSLQAVKLDLESLAEFKEIKERYIKKIQELEELVNINYDELIKTHDILRIKFRDETLGKNIKIFIKNIKIVRIKEEELIEKLLGCVKNKEQAKKTFNEEEKKQLLQLVKKQLHILKTRESFEILLQIYQKSYVTIIEIMQEFFKIIINHQKITPEYKKRFEIIFRDSIKLTSYNYCHESCIILQNHKKLLSS